MTGRCIFLAFVWLTVGSVIDVMAQETTAIVIEPAPIYLTPDASRTPLRTLAVNTPLRVIDEKGEWLQVEFRDPQFGARTGYLARNKVRIRSAQLPDPIPATQRPDVTPEPLRERQRQAWGIHAYGTYGSSVFAAKETLNAVAGSTRFANLGGGVTITNLWRNLFVDLGASQAKVDGHRVFVDGDTVYDLGIPLNVTVRPIDIAAGWRVTSGRLSTFLGAGMTSLYYEETSAFAEAADNVKDRRAGALFVGGIDVAVIKWVQLGGELRYRAVKRILGEGGASSVFGEDQVGGLSAGMRVSVGK